MAANTTIILLVWGTQGFSPSICSAHRIIDITETYSKGQILVLACYVDTNRQANGTEHAFDRAFHCLPRSGRGRRQGRGMSDTDVSWLVAEEKQITIGRLYDVANLVETKKRSRAQSVDAENFRFCRLSVTVRAWRDHTMGRTSHGPDVQLRYPEATLF